MEIVGVARSMRACIVGVIECDDACIILEWTRTQASLGLATPASTCNQTPDSMHANSHFRATPQLQVTHAGMPPNCKPSWKVGAENAKPTFEVGSLTSRSSV
mmetsp:Transcript_9675/g.26351  ORF Transcript_9675/g.26351 Transcript_9675/m.26351 type:complete len:102 (-) Transcript_9675:246-551(-)